jgi:hypothetical protein
MTNIVLLRCEAIAWVDHDWPGWVRVRLVDSTGHSWFFIDKVPIFFCDDPAGAIDFPAPVLVRCRVVSEGSGDVVTVSTATPDAVEAEDETTTFRVRADQIERHAFRNRGNP